MSDYVPKLVSLSLAHRLYGIPVSTLRRWCVEGNIAACRLGKLWYIDRHILDQLINDQKS